MFILKIPILGALRDRAGGRSRRADEPEPGRCDEVNGGDAAAIARPPSALPKPPGAARTAPRCARLAPRVRTRALAPRAAHAARADGDRPRAPGRRLRKLRPMSDTRVLSDGTIRRLVADGRVVDRPLGARHGPARLASTCASGDSFRVFHNHLAPAIDLATRPTNLPSWSDRRRRVVRDPPGRVLLGATLERVELPDDVVARIEGKSSARPPRPHRPRHRRVRDPGSKGTLTLEINNLTRCRSSSARQADRAAVVHGARPAGRAPYGHPELGSHYHGQVAATESRYEGGPAR